MVRRMRKDSVPYEEDCFTKLGESFKETQLIKSRFGVLHSRYSSSKKIANDLAHPHFDEKSRIAVFHNGYIANYEDLAR